MKSSTLLSPVALGPVTLPNRVVSTSHQTSLVTDHLPTDDLVAYHRARAGGEIGAIFLEATAVHPTGLLTPATIGGYLPEIVDGYRRLTEAIHAHPTKVFVQLFHGGREQITVPPRLPAVAPAAIPSARYRSEPRALTLAELGQIIDGYGVAARFAREGGLDGIELSFAHGYLAAQFFSLRTNPRQDRYGGGLEGRLRFAIEVTAAVRAAAGPDLAVGARLAANELGPDLLDAAACAEIAATLCRAAELDFVSFALGNSSTYAAATWIAPPPPAEENAIAAQIALAKAAVGSTPVIATTRIVDLDDAERIVADGTADAVGMTRALIADPDLVAKASGASSEPVIECIGCNQACIGRYHAGVPIGCVANLRTGSERSLRLPTKAPQGRRVLVIGGGPAGVAAAIEAARWGDDVELRERGAGIGGQLRLAAVAPAHAEVWERWLRTAHAYLDRHRVRVELECEVTEVETDAWDLVVLATGAGEYRTPLPELDGVDTMTAWDAIANPERAVGPVIVVDWGGDWAGLDAAEVLARAGHEVTLVSAALHPGETLHQYQRALYLSRLDAAGVKILHHLELAAEGGEVVVRHVFSGRSQPLPEYGTIVLAQGRAPSNELWPALEGEPTVRRVGDSLGARSLEEAMLEGAAAGYRG